MQPTTSHDDTFEALWAELVERITNMCMSTVSQRDDAWYAARRKTIGGSEIHKLMGLPGKDTPYLLAVQKIRGSPEEMALNADLRALLSADRVPYGRPEDLLAAAYQTMYMHRMHTPMTNGLAKHWGTVFEDVINEYMRVMYGLRVHCENMFYNPPGPFSYSPDGVTILPAEDGSSRLVPTLLEYKCPFTRVPGATIPPEYVAQMNSGMDLLGLEQSFYSEAVFRLCPWSVLGASAECRLDLRSTMRYPANPPLACGFVGVYGPLGIMSGVAPGDNYGGDSADLADMSVDEITSVFCMIAAGAFKVWYSPVCLDVARSQESLEGARQKFLEYCSGGHQPVGVLPWKLFSVTSKIVKKQEGFLDAWRPQGERLLEIIDICMSKPFPLEYLSAMMSDVAEEFD